MASGSGGGPAGFLLFCFVVWIFLSGNVFQAIAIVGLGWLAYVVLLAVSVGIFILIVKAISGS